VTDTPRRRTLGLIAGGTIASTLVACGLPERGAAVPAGRATDASVLGLANERFFPAHGSAALEVEVGLAMDRQVRALGLRSPAELPAWQLLAISGGGENGAFGAGLLCGWTEQGTRPEFELVTGISTGALSAPFAFLGPSYDGQLRSVYTETTPDRVLRKRSLAAALFDDAMADNAPLFGLISQYVDAAMLAAIARAYQSGRLLLVATTDLDAQQPVIWNIGAIAGSGHPRALDTARRVLLASSAIPAAFPPVMIDVTLDGETRQEMHVDGGAFAQTFLYPVALTAARRQKLARGGRVLRAEAFVIRNGRLDPEWAAVKRRTLGIAERAIAIMTVSAGFNDVVRIYDTARRDDIGYNLAYIGRDFTVPLPTPFDPAYMRALFDYGYQKALRGYGWAKRPPVV
jgi:predicted acylesterase/phospholipase RssA